MTARLAVSLLLALAPAATASRPLPLHQNGGTWDSGHVQGIAVDRRRGFIYYSFTKLLAKYDFDGRLIGTLAGWTGHLGDLDVDEEDGRVYGSLEYKRDKSFYIAVIDAARIDRAGMDARHGDVLRTVYLAEVAQDYAADLDGDGRVEDDPASPDHRYGCSGIDGVAFGPRFGRRDGPRYLTVAYGIYRNVARRDNDHQVLLQYDIHGWDRYASPLVERAPHHRGPPRVDGKYFVRTGNTTYGVQTLSYDAAQHRWFLGVYRGAKPAFPNYLLFAVDALTRPTTGDLVGVAAPGGGWQQAMLLTLADDGLRDEPSRIRGWMVKADVGFQPVGQGVIYRSVNAGHKGAQTAQLTLERWTGDAAQPLVPAGPDDLVASPTAAAPSGPGR